MELIDKLIESQAEEYQQQRSLYWDIVAKKMVHWRGWGGDYHRRVNDIYGSMIPQGARIIEIGSGNGDLLASLKPSYGVGIDFSSEMVGLAKTLHPDLIFVHASATHFELTEKFDFILFSDVLNDVWDVQAVFEHVRKVASADARLIINSYSRLWEFPLRLAAKLGLANPGLGQNWLTVSDITGLLNLSGFETIRTSREILFPLRIPVVAPSLNRFLIRFWPFNHLALTNFIISRRQPSDKITQNLPRVSVIVPARNEEGNIESIFKRIPEMGSGTELVFVEGHSTDNTYLAIQECVKRHPGQPCLSFQQTGKGKGDAVRLGFSKATGDILMILDADLTVPPEDLPRFYEGLVTRKGDFINGVRLVYPMEEEAMRFANLLGNKFFSLAFSWMLGQPIKDTLCGTKVLWKKDYERIAANRHVFGNFDPFGDFDLLFGAARLNFKIIDLPIRYRARTYGTTNIQRWKHGLLLLRMVFFAAKRIKFI
ncbi:MAG: glycosyltransferase [Chloroflexi bacterium]|nr:glycosyltransferase [Chloroflexota bacterium]